MRRILRKDGHALIITKNPNVLVFPNRKKKLLHSGQININLLEKKLKERGFLIEKIFPAILGKKLSWRLSRIIFDFLHRICLSDFGFLIPFAFKKYFSESFLIFARKL